MIKEYLPHEIYREFQLLDDILINSPSGIFTSEMRCAAFQALIEQIKESDIRKWYLIENFKWDFRGPEESTHLSVNYLKLLKELGCQRVIFVSKLQIPERFVVSKIFRKAGLTFDFMPHMESAISWIQYIKMKQEDSISAILRTPAM